MTSGAACRRASVGLSLGAIFAVVACSGPSVETADMVLRNGTIVTVDEAVPEVEALAVRGDRIIALGSNEEISAYVGDRTEVIDLEGRTAIPGFI